MIIENGKVSESSDMDALIDNEILEEEEEEVGELQRAAVEAVYNGKRNYPKDKFILWWQYYP